MKKRRSAKSDRSMHKSTTARSRPFKTRDIRPDRAVTMNPPPPGGYPGVLRAHLGFCLYKCALKLRTTLDATFLEAGLITPQFGILSILSSVGEFSQIDLSQKMAIDKATMVKLIDGLEALGFVKRTPHPQDRRVRIVQVTPSGASMFARLMIKAKEVELDFTRKLSADERETLRQLTSRLID